METNCGIITYNPGGEFHRTRQEVFQLVAIHSGSVILETMEKDALADIARATLKQYISDLSQIDKGSYEQNQIIEKTLSFLQQHAQLPLNLESIADHIGISKEHLCRIFKKSARKSPMSLYWQYKTKMARDLIVHTNRTFQDIAYELSFSSPYHFSRKVKEVTGRTPKEWRKGNLQIKNSDPTDKNYH